jgi:hypothetical protein
MQKFSTIAPKACRTANQKRLGPPRVQAGFSIPGHAGQGQDDKGAGGTGKERMIFVAKAPPASL